jgi:hypothetical protein
MIFKELKKEVGGRAINQQALVFTRQKSIMRRFVNMSKR